MRWRMRISEEFVGVCGRERGMNDLWVEAGLRRAREMQERTEQSSWGDYGMCRCSLDAGGELGNSGVRGRWL